MRIKKHHALGSSIDGPSQPTCLPGQVEFEIKVQEVFKSFSRNFTNGALTDTRKNCVQEFGEKSCSDSGCAVWNNTRSWDDRREIRSYLVLTSKDKRTGDNPNSFTRSYFEIKGVHYSFKQGRDLNV